MSYPLVGTFPIFQPSYTLVAWRIGYDHGVVGVGGIRGALHASMIVTHALEDHVPGKRPDVTREMPVCDLSPNSLNLGPYKINLKFSITLGI